MPVVDPSVPVVLVLLGCFSRGNDATGPNPSMIGLARGLSDRFRFRVLGSATEEDTVGRWTTLWGVEQMPLRVGVPGARGLLDAVRETPHDLAIVSGFFDRTFTIPYLLARRMSKVPKKPLIIAPHGEFSPGALLISKHRKRAYLAFAKSAGLLDGAVFQAVADPEAEHIRAIIGDDVKVIVTPPMRPESVPVEAPPHTARADGEPLRIVFLSRIDRKKNLRYALDRLGEVGLPLSFDVIGPCSDEAYLRECRERAAALPDPVRVHFQGPVPQEEVIHTLAKYDLFFLPTLGENYGHAIADALSAGTPALLSDETPWQNLEAANAGWDLPLSEPASFVAAIRNSAGASSEDLLLKRLAARRFVAAQMEASAAAEIHAIHFQELVRGGVS